MVLTAVLESKSQEFCVQFLIQTKNNLNQFVDFSICCLRRLTIRNKIIINTHFESGIDFNFVDFSICQSDAYNIKNNNKY